MEQPPFTITPSILSLLAKIAEEIGRLGLSENNPTPPKLRRVNRIKSIHASLAIENNTLSIEQVTALLDGKRVLGPVKEVQEVRNAFDSYEALGSWNPHQINDLLNAHALMMKDLVDHPGTFRSEGGNSERQPTILRHLSRL